MAPKEAIEKINYRIHTDAVKENLLKPSMSRQVEGYTYANEADVLNVALFGMTAKQWRESHEGATGNIRDEASLHQLLVLANLESMNAELIKRGIDRRQRAAYLREMAISQLSTLEGSPVIAKIEADDGIAGELPEDGAES